MRPYSLRFSTETNSPLLRPRRLLKYSPNKELLKGVVKALSFSCSMRRIRLL